MGYTHYWRTNGEVLPLLQWTRFAMDVQRILKTTVVPVRFEYDDAEPPQVTGTRVRFNGVSDNGHETFLFERHQPRDAGLPDSFAFCKTAAKPYDTVVCAVLIAAKANFGNLVTISSDGDWKDWSSGRALYADAFGIVPGCCLDGE